MNSHPSPSTHALRLPTFLFAVCGTAFAQEHPASLPPSAARRSPDVAATPWFDVPSLRSEHAKHYALPGGGYRMELTPEGTPQHWWDGSAWRDFELVWRPALAGEARGGFQFTCQEHGLRTWLLADSPMGEWVRLELGGLAVQWVPLHIGPESEQGPWGASTGSTPAGDAIEIAYVGTGGRKSAYTLLRNGLKHDVVLPSPPPAALGAQRFVLSWALIVEGADAMLGDGGADLRGGGEASSIAFVADAMERRLVIPPIVVRDGSGRMFGDRETGSGYRLSPQGGDLFVLEAIVPMPWLLSSQRVWPLHVDPTATVYHGTPCTSAFNSLGALDNTGWAGNVTDVNWDRTLPLVAGCTVQDNARTFAFARFPSPSANATVVSNGGLIRAGHAEFRFASVGNNSAWDLVMGTLPNSPAGYHFDLCQLTGGTSPANTQVFNRIDWTPSGMVVGSASGWNAMSSYVGSTYVTPDFAAAVMSASGFPAQPVELAWRAQPNAGASGCATISSSTAHTRLRIDWEPPTDAPWTENVTSSSLRVRWNPVQGATRYTLKVASTAFSGIQTYSNITTTYRDFPNGLQPSALYDFVVVAENAYHAGGNSPVGSDYTLPATPAVSPPTSATVTGFQANWQPAAGATSYELTVYNGLFGSTIAWGPQLLGGTSHVVTGLTPSSPYGYSVRAFNSTSQKFSEESQRQAAQTLTLGTTGGVSISNVGGTSCTASWNAAAGATHYQLEWAMSPGFAGAGTLTTTATSATVNSLTPGTYYHVHVRAGGGSAGPWGPWSATANFTTTSTPAAPTTLSATNVTAGGFVARWTSVSNATHYVLDVSTSPTFGSYVGNFWDYNVGNTTSHPVTGLTPNTTYHYRVRAWNGGTGPSPDSNTTSVTTASPTGSTPAAPQALPATGVTMTTFVAQWSAVAGATGYRLDVARDAAFTDMVPGFDNRAVGNVTTFPVSGLAPAATYHYRVRAENGFGSSGNSNAVSVPLLQNPVPSLTSLAPSVALQDGPTLVLVVDGAEFAATSKVQWNGGELETTWLSSTRLQAVVTAALLATSGSATVTVVTPAPGGGVSNARTFTVAPAGSGLPPANLRVVSVLPTASQLLRWELPPDHAAASELRVRRYARPDRSGTPLVYTLPASATQIAATVFPEGVYYFDVVIVRNGVVSVPMQLVKICYTDNRIGGDVDGDGLVDGRDLMDVLAALGSEADHPLTGGRWNPAADCNGDGRVDASDLVHVSDNLGNRQ